MKRKTLLLLSLFIVACAPTAETSKTEQRLNELEIRLAKLEEKQTETSLKLEQINKRLDLLTKEVGSLKLARTAQGVPEESKRITTDKSPQEIPKRIEQSPTYKESFEATPRESSEDEKVAYERAISLYNQGRLVEARDAFLKFLKDYPPNNYTDNAYFWLGRIYYELGRREMAKQSFNTLISKCEGGELPDCNKLPDAYFMLIRMAVDEGDVATAKKYLSVLEEKFPQSEATQRARALLYKER